MGKQNVSIVVRANPSNSNPSQDLIDIHYASKETAGKYFYIVANVFLNNEPSMDLLHLSAISRSGMFLVMI